MIQPKFFDYTLCLYAYTNVNTSQDVYYVARLNDYVKEMFCTDAQAPKVHQLILQSNNIIAVVVIYVGTDA